MASILPAPQPPKNAETRPTGRILIIDDDALVLQLLVLMVDGEGYDSSAHASGPAALAWLANPPWQPDLVLADLQMPGLSGASLAAALRQACPAGTPLIAISGSEPRLGSANGYDTFLLKPFDLESLRHALKTTRSSPHPARHHRPTSSSPRLISELNDPEPNDPAVNAPTPNASTPNASTPNASTPNPPAPNDLRTDDPKTPHPTTTVPALDEAIYARLAASMSESSLRQLCALALTDIRLRCERIASAAALNDLLTVHSEAHALKGGCGMIGASELQTIARDLEAYAADAPHAGPLALEGTCARLLLQLPVAVTQLQGMLIGRTDLGAA